MSKAIDKIYKQYRKIEPEITESIKDIAEKKNVTLCGLENRFKKKKTAKKKIERFHETISPYELKDILRYTYILPNYNFVLTADNIIAEIEQQTGYTCIERKNYWADEKVMYKGYNVEFAKGKLKFEVQFHTDKSAYIRDISHGIYEEKRKLCNKQEYFCNLEKILWSSVDLIN